MSSFEDDEDGENWDLHPKSEAEASQWRELEFSSNICNVAKSKYSGETIIRDMGSHAWNSSTGDLVPASLLSNPNLTPELIVWLDSNPGTWSITAIHNYWVERYKLVNTNSNFYQGQEEPGPTRGFRVDLIDSKLDLHDASSAILEIANHFAEQMWHDLAEQKHLTLNYWNREYGSDKFFPEFGSDQIDTLAIRELDEDILEIISPGSHATWIDRDDSFDIAYARSRAEDSDGGLDHFLGNYYIDEIGEDPFPYMNLGMAIGAGFGYGDIELVDDKFYDFYLEQAFGDDVEMVETKVTITSDTPWVGIRYRELAEGQQMNLAINLWTTMGHPYLGRPDGISRHFLCCLALHDSTAENVKAFLLLQLAGGL